MSFWDKKIEYKDEPHMVRIEGQHYIIGSEFEDPINCGYGGRKFVIKFKDGRKVVTHNLWHQGTIPDELRNILTDNATFSKEAMI